MAGRDAWLTGFDASEAELQLARASQKSTLRLRLVVPGAEVTQAELSHDRTRVMTISDDNTVRIWNASTGRELTGIQEQEQAGSSQPGLREVTVLGGIARAWDEAAGRELARFEIKEEDAAILTAAFSPDGGVTVLHGQDLIEAVCREVLSVDVSAEPFAAELSRLSPEELRLAPVLDPAIDADACRPATFWQRIKSIFAS